MLENIKDRKIIVFKKEEDKIQEKGIHRQPLSKIQITKILSKGGKIVAEIDKNKIKLSNETKSDKKLSAKKNPVVKKNIEKKQSVKKKIKK